MTAPRLAIWSAGVPHATEGASTVLFWHYITGLHAAGFDVLSVLMLQPDNTDPDGLETYRARARERGIEVAVCDADSFIIERHRSITLRRDTVARALEEVARFKPDITFSLDLVAAWATRTVSGPRVVWLGDLRYQTVWYHALYSARERFADALRLPLALARAFLWRRVYRDVLFDADDVIVSSKSSERALRRLGVTAAYEPYPWPAPEGRADDADRPGRPTFLFLGTLQALGSRSALHFLLDRLYPRLVERWGHDGFRIVIAGRGDLPGWARDALATRPEFEHVGFVDDLAALLSSVHAAIAPISVPVGNRSRILSALAAGTVVVAHENASLGNPELVDGVTCYLARDPADFAERMARCVELPAEARAVAARGRALYFDRFRPSVAVRAVADRLSAVLSDAVDETGREGSS
jgi:glycosyltransferase involved in cell wall biosynthesis